MIYKKISKYTITEEKKKPESLKKFYRIYTY